MSYGGHVLDMIKRSKEGRESLNRHRERSKRGRKMHIGSGNSPQNLTAEQFEEINQALKENEVNQQRNLNRMTLFVICGIIVATIMVCLVVKLFFL